MFLRYYHGQSMEEIGHNERCSRQRIQQIIERCLKKMRRGEFLRRLKEDYLN